MILAGGVGERLYPLTANRAKPAVPFGGNFRIIDFTLLNCMCSGLRRVHILAQYHAQSLSSHRADRWSFLAGELGEFIELVPPKLRAATGVYHGTADAIYRNLDLLDRCRPDLVLVLSGDHVYRADYQRFIESHLERDAAVTVLTGLVPSPEASAFGVVQTTAGGRIAAFIEKPQDPGPFAEDGKCLVNLGVYCFQTQFLVRQLVADAKKKTAHDFGRNILPAALERGAATSCPLEAISPDVTPYWRDVGSLDSYFQANMDLLRLPPAFALADPRWPPTSRFHEWLPASAPASARIAGRNVLGRNLLSSGVEVEHAELANCILSPRVRVGRGSELEECILFPRAEVGEGSQLRRVIVEEGVQLPPGTRIGFGGDSRQFTTSPGGVVVVSSNYRAAEAVAPVFAEDPLAGELESPEGDAVETGVGAPGGA
jgi:glucose-1-phosphate adenylyltransferase